VHSQHCGLITLDSGAVGVALLHLWRSAAACLKRGSNAATGALGAATEDAARDGPLPR
jgi:hypothetical protein